MNKLTTISILFFLSSFGWSQAPMGTLNTKWTYEGWSQGNGWQPNWEGNCEGNVLLFEVTSEVEIDGKTCGVITNNKDNESLIIYQEADIVYFYEDSTFLKLYDYTAVKGDTIQSFRPSNGNSFTELYQPPEFNTSQKPDTIYTIILDHDTTTINGIELKRWKTEPIYLYEQNYSYSNFETIIENIGSMTGIAGTNGIKIAEGCSPGFVCYESDEFLFGSDFFTQCDFTSSAYQQEEQKFSIYPNPAYNEVFIVAIGYQIKEIELLDLNGKILSSTQDRQLDLSNFQAGIYFIAIIDTHNQRFVKKIIKQ